MTHRVSLLLMLACLLGPLRIAAQVQDTSPHSEARLVSEVQAIQAGAPFTVALHMSMDENWHSYWKNPGDAGLPTEIDWRLPPGFEAGPIQWPFPERIDLPPLASYGYSDQVLLLVTIQPPPDLVTGDTVTLEGKAKWLICELVCLPAEEELALTLPVANQLPETNDHWSEAFEAARALHPIAMDEAWSVRAAHDSSHFQLLIEPASNQRMNFEGIQFFPEEKRIVHYAGVQNLIPSTGKNFLLVEKDSRRKDEADVLSGVLVLPERGSWNEDGARAMYIRVPVEPVAFSLPTLNPDLAEGAISSIWMALFLAFSGGVLLNLMPCVFPVLSIKVLGFVQQAGNEKNRIRLHGIVFGAGVLMTFLLLAGILLVLRAGGSQIGWGFQLQSPVIVALMALLMFAIGLNLMGVFEFGATLMKLGGFTGQNKGGYSDSFFSGVLASIVATPCTAPFMGVALGFAMVQPAFIALAIFACLGVGMAMPYVLLSFLPRLLKKLPPPGAWMQTFKHVLAFPMFATVVWLVWVFGLQAGIDAVAFLMIGFVLMGLAGWIVGHWDIYTVQGTKRIVTRIIAGIALVGAVWVSLNGIPPTAENSDLPVSSANLEQGEEWNAFSIQAVEEARSLGNPVFIDFTAAWCISCQVNKKLVLNKPRVMQAFRDHNVLLFRADWTSRDDEITQTLESFGRNGVPLYVFYQANQADPVILPEVLTQRIVLQAIESASSLGETLSD